MKYVDEYRDAALVKNVIAEIRRTVTHPWTLMEICGGQTHAIVRHGIDQMLPEGVTLLHGPGCPVCVTPARMIDAAIAIARRPNGHENDCDPGPDDVAFRPLGQGRLWR